VYIIPLHNHALYNDDRYLKWFINSSTITSEIRDTLPEKYLNDYKQTIEKHFIPIELFLWRLENFEEFEKVRVKNVFNNERQIPNNF